MGRRADARLLFESAPDGFPLADATVRTAAEPRPRDRGRRQAHPRREPQRRGPPRDRGPGRPRLRHHPGVGGARLPAAAPRPEPRAPVGRGHPPRPGRGLRRGRVPREDRLRAREQRDGHQPRARGHRPQDRRLRRRLGNPALRARGARTPSPRSCPPVAAARRRLAAGPPAWTSGASGPASRPDRTPRTRETGRRAPAATPETARTRSGPAAVGRDRRARDSPAAAAAARVCERRGHALHWRARHEAEEQAPWAVGQRSER